ncbi:unnamed protein product [Vitrella brassicaformis CCMP3155]|uniref:Protein kinase domain-containing protein n=2 Tax=Vitrella brassicaformis TaxID=1169539 RepID=A0A0G4EDF1_VITBC|nr:unnamed protein product [Vitrella brassicaformis CCMP3155]|eukprot:CEL93395.1 unnamed protein product [Vitrella brassicaformis CCMP3155]
MGNSIRSEAGSDAGSARGTHRDSEHPGGQSASSVSVLDSKISRGYGKFEFNTGDVYEGEYEGKYKHGIGTYLYHNGDVYVGEFYRNARQGWGVYITAGNERYEGQWAADRKSGYGLISLKHGIRFIGQFKNDKQHGLGVCFLANGSLFAEWRKDGRETRKVPLFHDLILPKPSDNHQHQQHPDRPDGAHPHSHSIGKSRTATSSPAFSRSRSRVRDRDRDHTRPHPDISMGHRSPSEAGGGQTSSFDTMSSDSSGDEGPFIMDHLHFLDRLPVLQKQQDGGEPAAATAAAAALPVAAPGVGETIKKVVSGRQNMMRWPHPHLQGRLPVGRDAQRIAEMSKAENCLGWSTSETCHFLRCMGLERFVDIFEKDAINGAVIPLLSERELRALGVVDERACKLLYLAFSLLLKLRHRAISKKSLADGFETFLKSPTLSLILIDPRDIQLDHCIGEGGYGKVFKGRLKNNEVVACKIFRAKDKDTVAKGFYQELSVLHRLRHPNVIQLLGLCLDQRYMIVMEFLPCGSLFDVLHRHKLKLEPRKILRISRDICSGMAYLHEQGVLHCDLKSSNIVVSNNWDIKICDFGLSSPLRDYDRKFHMTCPKMLGAVGTHHWMAPEVLRGDEFTQAADVYSFGMILWEMVCRQIPHHGLTQVQITATVGYGMRTAKIPDEVPETLRRILEACLAPLPEDRPSFRDLAEQFDAVLQTAILDFEENLREFFGAYEQLPPYDSPADLIKARRQSDGHMEAKAVDAMLEHMTKEYPSSDATIPQTDDEMMSPELTDTSRRGTRWPFASQRAIKTVPTPIEPRQRSLSAPQELVPADASASSPLAPGPQRPPATPPPPHPKELTAITEETEEEPSVHSDGVVSRVVLVPPKSEPPPIRSQTSSGQGCCAKSSGRSEPDWLYRDDRGGAEAFKPAAEEMQMQTHERDGNSDNGSGQRDNDTDGKGRKVKEKESHQQQPPHASRPLDLHTRSAHYWSGFERWLDVVDWHHQKYDWLAHRPCDNPLLHLYKDQPLQPDVYMSPIGPFRVRRHLPNIFSHLYGSTYHKHHNNNNSHRHPRRETGGGLTRAGEGATGGLCEAARET